MKKYRVTVDVGGTFTDVCVMDVGTGAVEIVKVPSQPSNPAAAIIDGVVQAGVDPSEMELFVHGTTVGTNALVTRSFPRAGLITTKGFRDVLEIRKSTKPDLWDAYVDVAPPYIQRRDRLEVEERVSYDGEVLTPLRRDDVVAAARAFRRRGIRSVAVCLINSYVNADHEREILEILSSELPDAIVTLSSDVHPEIFEFERVSTTVVNAVLAPVVGEYMRTLESDLRGMGYEGDVLVLHSGGGTMTAETVTRFGARIAASGPAGGAVAMAAIARQCGFENALGFDVGGTTSDVSIMAGGELRMTKEWGVEFGYPISFPSVELVTVGAGGGSLAWIDQGGSLRSGPQSAGASPGPAAYERGGADPTTTDANVVLGRLGTDLIGGRMTLSREAAVDAVDRVVGEPFGLSTELAASAVVDIAVANMTDAIRLMSIQRGYDPRDFALVAFGGGGPLHAAEVARGANIPTVIVPPTPGVTSAYGCLLVDIRHDLTRTFVRHFGDDAFADALAALAELAESGVALVNAEGDLAEAVRVEYFIDMRYVGQWRNISIPCARESSAEEILRRFHEAHAREYAYSREGHQVEISGLRVAAIGRISKPEVAASELGASEPPAPRRVRPVYDAALAAYVDTGIWDRDQMRPGMELQGPAVIEQSDTTTFIPSGASAEVDRFDNILIHL